MARQLEPQAILEEPISLVDHRPLSGSLPHPLTSLIGREADIASLVRTLMGEEHRLVTITGPGGIGKTRLAIAVGSTMTSHVTHGVSFIELSAVSAAELVPSAISAALGIPVRPGQSAEQALIGALRHRRHLLVVDNVEHVLDVAPFLATLLQQCHTLRVLATSRSALRVNGETVLRVPPLAIPEHAGRFDLRDPDATAIRLFVERATALDAGFSLGAHGETVAAICRQLDGLPLAIELAVGRLGVMAPTTMLHRLMQGERRLPLLSDGQRDAPDRLQTMERAIRWSYDLLSPESQHLFRVVSAFTGGCTWDALETVATGAGIDRESLTDLLSDLVEHSLVERRDAADGSGTRYTMLETIREFGAAQLAHTGDEANVRTAHARWCERFARQNEYCIHTGPVRHRLTMARARAEIPNLRSALEWTFGRGEAERALAISGANAFAWSLMDLWAEAAAWIERALALPGANDADPNVRLWATSALARLDVMLARYDLASSTSQAAEAMLPLADDPLTHAHAVWMRGVVRAYSGDNANGSIDCGTASRAFDACGHPGLALTAEYSAARAESLLPDPSHGRQRLERLLASLPPDGHDFLSAMTLSVLAGLALADGNHAQSRCYLDEGAPILLDMGEFWILALHIENVARLEAADHPAWSLAIMEAAGAWRTSMSFPIVIDDRPIYQNLIAQIRTRLTPAEFDAARALGSSMPMRDAIAFAFNPPWRTPTSPGTGQTLTAREREVLRLVADGASDKEVAATLGISRRTASRHVASILDKLDVGSRTAAATLAIREGLVSSPPA